MAKGFFLSENYPPEEINCKQLHTGILTLFACLLPAFLPLLPLSLTLPLHLSSLPPFLSIILICSSSDSCLQKMPLPDMSSPSASLYVYKGHLMILAKKMAKKSEHRFGKSP